jgi:hypothetical protein
MAATPAGAETLSAFCFAMPCRTRRQWTRVLDSAPVFECKGCGVTRQFDELGRGAGEIPPVAAPRNQGAVSEPARRQRRSQENNMRKPTKQKLTPLQSALEGAARHATLALEERLTALEKAVKASESSVDDKAIRELVAAVCDSTIKESLSSLVAQELLRQLGGTAGPTTKFPRAPGHKHRGACGHRCFQG